ncbi:uncharacterized protein LOC124711520 [Schistocerca piceifrons]|uniref:uncharacterized protein LOC124711520 n=1 Tax=Schistocerca piceifrons TaxID=274613 RepID=UPI001F5EF306|nr:uncharacterized protein LOC124711520 [Schistocerca piceifrons]
MSRIVFSLLLAAVLAAVAVSDGSAMPADNHRVKRMSDHRVAELQTLLSMGKMGGKVVTHKVGYGQVDPMKVGRRRRSDPRMLSRLQQLLLSAAAGDSHEQLPEQEEEQQHLQLQLDPTEEDERQVLLQLLEGQRQAQSPQQQQEQQQPRLAWWPRTLTPQL